MLAGGTTAYVEYEEKAFSSSPHLARVDMALPIRGIRVSGACARHRAGVHKYRVRIQKEEVENVHDEVVIAGEGRCVCWPVGHGARRNPPCVPERTAVFEKRKPFEPRPDEIVR